MKTHVEAKYIESGAFQGGEEDVFKAGILRGETCVIMRKLEHNELTTDAEQWRKWKHVLNEAVKAAPPSA